jgi:hypothetical protein
LEPSGVTVGTGNGLPHGLTAALPIDSGVGTAVAVHVTVTVLVNVRVRVLVGVRVFDRVAVFVRVFVAVRVRVFVRVFVAERVCDGVNVLVAVRVAVRVRVLVRVFVAVRVRVSVRVCDGVNVLVAVRVAVRVRVLVRVFVAVRVRVAVCVVVINGCIGDADTTDGSTKKYSIYTAQIEIINNSRYTFIRMFSFLIHLFHHIIATSIYNWYFYQVFCANTSDNINFCHFYQLFTPRPTPPTRR